jgi:hypothetical protein
MGCYEALILPSMDPNSCSFMDLLFLSMLVAKFQDQLAVNPYITKASYVMKPLKFKSNQSLKAELTSFKFWY